MGSKLKAFAPRYYVVWPIGKDDLVAIGAESVPKGRVALQVFSMLIKV
jgi:hypothetical protein